jgi:hypothetical protein
MICPRARAKTIIFNLLTYMACLEFHMGPSWCMVGHHGSVRVQAMAEIGIQLPNLLYKIGLWGCEIVFQG